MLFKDTNQIKRNYYLNLFSANAEIKKNGNNNFMYEWNIRDLQLGKYSEIALVQLASINADITVERQYPPKLYTSSTEETTTSSEITNILPTNVYKQTITLNTSGITYGFGDYIIYSSSIYPTGNQSQYRKRDLFNYDLNEVGGHWNDNYNGSTGIYNGNNYIKSDYLGDWIIIKLPNPIILERFRFYHRASLVNQAPSAWRCYGSNDGNNWIEINSASNDTTPLTSASYDANRMYEKIVNSNTSYLYIGFTFNKKIFDATQQPYLCFVELQLFGREKLNIMPPVLWYKFDGSATDMLLDSSGNNYHLTNSGATFDGTNFKRGYGSSAFNQAFNQFLTVPTTINLNNINIKNGITFSFWVRLTGGASYGRIFDFGRINGSDTFGSDYIMISRNALENNLFFDICTGAGNNNSNKKNYITSGINFFNSTWYHIVWSISTTGIWNIYINNSSLTIPTETSSIIPSITTTRTNYILKSLFANDGYLSGNVDDFRIYDYVLNANEISGLYNGTDPTTQNKYIIRSLNCYDDGYDSQNTTSAILYMNNELTNPKQPSYHKLNTYNLNRISLQVSDNIEQNKPYNGWKPDLQFGAVFHIVDNQDNNI